MAERVIVLSRRPGRVKSDHAIHFATSDGVPPQPLGRAQRAGVQRLFQHALAGARSPCRRLKSLAVAVAEPAISGMAQARTARPSVRAGDAGRDPCRVPGAVGGAAEGADRQSRADQLSVGAVADLRLELLKSTPQQASILTHTWATVLATILGFTGAMVLGTAVAAALWWWNSALQGAGSLPRRRQRHAEDGVRADLLHLARRHDVDLRHVARDFRVHHHPDDLFGLPGHRPQQDQACADVRRDQGADFNKGRPAWQRAHAGGCAQGECRACRW